MVEIVAEWAGQERVFRLAFGGVLDLEEATGDGIGTIFLAVAGSQFKAAHVYQTIRLALKGGGTDPLMVQRLMDLHFDQRPYMENATMAGKILSALMVGVEPGDDPSGEIPERHKFSEVSQICRVFNISPIDLREMPYADFVNMVRGFNAASQTKAPHLTEEEFADILNRFEPVQE